MILSFKEERTVMAKKVKSKSNLTIQFDADIYDKIQDYANQNEMDKSKVIRLAVKTFLSQPKRLTGNLKAS